MKKYFFASTFFSQTKYYFAIALIVVLFTVMNIKPAFAYGINIHLRSITGQNLQTSYFKNKMLFITVFQNDCEYCQMEVPNLNRFYHNPEIREWFIIIGINPYNSINGIKNFQRDYNVEYPLYQASMSDVLSMLHTEFTPTSYVILNGKILGTFYGKHSYLAVKHALIEIIQEVKQYAF